MSSLREQGAVYEEVRAWYSQRFRPTVERLQKEQAEKQRIVAD